MSIKGKVEGISRFVGYIIILISIVLEMILVLILLDNLILNLSLIFITTPAFVFSILLKVEQDFVVKYARIIFYLLIIEIIIPSIVLLEFYVPGFIIKFYLFPCSILLLITCWHTSLTLHKNKKIIFLISSVGYFCVNAPIWVKSIVIPFFSVANVYLKLTVFLGIILIITAELIMKKKGLLNYI